MFSLASGIYQNYFATPQLTVLLIGAEGVGKTTLLERVKVTQFAKKPKIERASMRRSLSCPAPPKYANAKVEDDAEDFEPESSLDSNSERVKPSRRWLDERQLSSMEDVQWSGELQQPKRKSTKDDTKEPTTVTQTPTPPTSDTPIQTDYDLKPGQKMLPLEKIRPTSGQNLAKLDICGARCHIFDVSGKFKGLWERYYGDAEAVIFCWRLGDDEQSQRELLEEVRKEIPDDVPFLIFGHVLHETDYVDFNDVPMSTEFYIPNYHSNLMLTFSGSAKTGKGVREAMEWLIPLAKVQAKVRLQASTQTASEEP